MFEWIDTGLVGNDGVIAELERGGGQWSMTTAVIAGVATIIIIVLFKGGARTVVRRRNFTTCRLGACG